MITLDRVAFTLFGVDVYYYGIIMALAILACLIVAVILCKVKKIDVMKPVEIFLAIVPAGLLSARLFSVIFEADLSIVDFFNFRTGGMSIFGAIIGGALGMLIYKLVTKQSFLSIADIATSVLFLGQSIGRWGNYFNEEVYGQLVTNSKLQFFPYAVQIDGSWYEALFFWESVLTLIGFIALLIVYLKTKKTGLVTGIYFLYYGIIRVILEFHRQQEFVLKWGSVPVSALVSCLFILIGISVIIYIIVKSRKEKQNSGGEKIHQQ